MKKPDDTFTKICMNCGQRKPLSAFLQFDNKIHGSICSSCRKTAIEEDGKEQDESTRSTTGEKIDAKAKVKDVSDKREALKQIEDEYFEEWDKKEEKKTERTEKIARVEEDAKKHRDSSQKKSSFLDKRPPARTTSLFGGEEQKAEAGKLDFTVGTGDLTRVAGQVKITQSPTYDMFMHRLGKSGIGGSAEKAKQNKKPQTEASDPASEFIHNYKGPRRP